MRIWNRGKRFVKLQIKRLALLLTGACLLFMVYAQVLGVPFALTQPLLNRVSPSNWLIRADRLELMLPSGVRFYGVKLYRRGVVGPPAFESSIVEIGLRWSRITDGAAAVRLLGIQRGVLRPDQMGREDDTAGPARLTLDCRLHLEQFDVYGVRVVQLWSDLEANGSDLHVRRIHARIAQDRYAGPVRGEATIDLLTETARGTLETRIDPHLLKPMLAAWNMPFTIRLIERFEFHGSPPRIEASFVRGPGGQHIDVSAWFLFSDGSYRGVLLRQAGGEISVRGGDDLVVTVNPLFLWREEGYAAGAFTLDEEIDEVRFHGESTISPPDLFQMVDIGGSDFFDDFRFDGTSYVTASGTVSLAENGRHWFRGHMDLAEAQWRWFRFDRVVSPLEMKGVSLHMTNMVLHGYGGQVMCDMVVVPSGPPPASTSTWFRIAAETMNWQGADLVRDLAPGMEGEFTGTVRARLRVSGFLEDDVRRESWQGEGRIRIRDGRVFVLPLFGGLTEYMSRLIPGLDFLMRQSNVTADFVIQNGRVRSDEILVSGDVLSMNGRGSYVLADDRLSYKVQITLLQPQTFLAKALRLLMYPVSKLFEFRLTGTLSEPVWYPINFSGEMLERIGLDGLP